MKRQRIARVLAVLLLVVAMVEEVQSFHASRQLRTPIRRTPGPTNSSNVTTSATPTPTPTPSRSPSNNRTTPPTSTQPPTQTPPTPTRTPKPKRSPGTRTPSPSNTSGNNSKDSSAGTDDSKPDRDDKDGSSTSKPKNDKKDKKDKGDLDDKNDVDDKNGKYDKTDKKEDSSQGSLGPSSDRNADSKTTTGGSKSDPDLSDVETSDSKFKSESSKTDLGGLSSAGSLMGSGGLEKELGNLTDRNSSASLDKEVGSSSGETVVGDHSRKGKGKMPNQADSSKPKDSAQASKSTAIYATPSYTTVAISTIAFLLMCVQS